MHEEHVNPFAVLHICSTVAKLDTGTSRYLKKSAPQKWRGTHGSSVCHPKLQPSWLGLLLLQPHEAPRNPGKAAGDSPGVDLSLPYPIQGNL